MVEEAVEHERDPQVQGEVINAMHDVCDLNANSSLSLNEHESMLNGDQKRVYDSVKDHLLHQQQHETGACQCKDFKPLCKFVSGVGGTGKSFLIETITLLIISMWPKKHQTCAIVKCLTEHVITVSVVEKFQELQEAGQSPVCLFPTRELCNQLNNEMLASLPSPKVDIFSSDNVDETASMRKWNNKAQKHLERLNSDINQTAGLEGKLTLCIGARVMLRKNIDVSTSLVNGAIGTVLSIKPSSIQIKFDNIPKACDIEMVTNKFVLLKHYSVYKSNFPLS